MKIKPVDPRLWRQIIEALTPLNQVRVNAAPEKISVRHMDPSHVMMISVELTKEHFEAYDVQEPLSFGLIVADWLKMMGKPSDAPLELTFEKATSKLIMVSKGEYSRTVTMPTMDMPDEALPTPKIVFDSSAKMVSEAFADIVDDCILSSDHVKISIQKDSLIFDAKGNLAASNIILKQGDDALLSVSGESVAAFSLDYLKEMARVKDINDIIDLSLSTDKPLRLQANFAGGFIEYYLAPRVESM